MKQLFAVAVAMFASLSVVSGALAVPSELAHVTTVYDGLRLCPTGTPVANVYQSVVNDPDVGLAGNVWAYENYTRQIVIYRLSSGSYCAGSNYSGTFWGVPGATSPGGANTVGVGVFGSIGGGWRTTVFTGTWRAIVPVTGAIPSSINGGYDNWDDLFFADVQGLNIALWTYTYNGGTHGWWANRSLTGNFGDIV